MGELTDRERALVALGAAIASNCLPCTEHYIPEARKAGCSEAGIREAVQTADRVRRAPARMVLETALARIEDNGAGPAETKEEGCGCQKPC